MVIIAERKITAVDIRAAKTVGIAFDWIKVGFQKLSLLL
jgi:hypothetical protein